MDYSEQIQINLQGVAVREYQTDIGPADYVLFVNKQPVGIIEAKRAEEAVRLTVHEELSEGYLQPNSNTSTIKSFPLYTKAQAM